VWKKLWKMLINREKLLYKGIIYKDILSNPVMESESFVDF